MCNIYVFSISKQKYVEYKSSMQSNMVGKIVVIPYM